MQYKTSELHFLLPPSWSSLDLFLQRHTPRIKPVLHTATEHIVHHRAANTQAYRSRQFQLIDCRPCLSACRTWHFFRQRLTTVRHFVYWKKSMKLGRLSSDQTISDISSYLVTLWPFILRTRILPKRYHFCVSGFNKNAMRGKWQRTPHNNFTGRKRIP